MVQIGWGLTSEAIHLDGTCFAVVSRKEFCPENLQSFGLRPHVQDELLTKPMVQHTEHYVRVDDVGGSASIC